MTMNSTISELVQDNSDVSPETNPIAPVQSNELIFGQKHNDIDCALCPTAKRACDRAWVTAKQIENWSKMSTTTLWRWLERLEKARRISRFSDLKNVTANEFNLVKILITWIFRHRLESTHVGRDSRLCFRQQVGENENPTKTIGECKHV